MNKFSDIGRFRNAVQSVHRYCHERGLPLPVYNYVGTVKLHGTNGGIRRTPKGVIRPQSRNRILDVSSDNYGFAQFVVTNEARIRELFDKHFAPEDDVTIYGEWCGKTVQGGHIALAQLEPHFVIFNYRVNGEYQTYPFSDSLQDNEIGIWNIFQIPHFEKTVDFSNPDLVAEEINELTNQVEDECPWGKFRGVQGIGEGIVWVPREHPELSDLWFKTKGGKHSGGSRVKGIKAKVSVEKAQTITECLELVLPEWRLQQGIDALKEMHCGIVDHGSIGHYIQWVAKDIMKEEMDTIVENGLEWKEIVKQINVRARNYILDYLNRG